MPDIPEHKFDDLIKKAINYGLQATEYKCTKTAEWWNANNTNKMIGFWRCVKWDKLPEHAQDDAIKLYELCQH